MRFPKANKPPPAPLPLAVRIQPTAFGGDLSGVTSNITVTETGGKTAEEIATAVDNSHFQWDYEDKDVQETYIYYGFSSNTGWRIKRKTIATRVYGTATGTGDYATAWSDRANKNYV